MIGLGSAFGHQARSRTARLLVLFALAGAPAGTEAWVLRATGFSASVALAPQVSALWPYGTFHDLRWVLVYHRSWAMFLVESLAAIAFRGLLDTALTFVAWPAGTPRPGLGRLASRNFVFAAALGAFLTPWASLAVVSSDVSLSWYVFGELAPLLLMAPVLQRGGIVPGWWKGLPPAGTILLSLINFATITASGALVLLAPNGWTILVAALTGGANGLLWERAVRLAVQHKPVRWRRVPVLGLVIGLVIGLMFGLGYLAQLGTNRSTSAEPPAIASLEMKDVREPVIFVGGYESSYGGEPSGYTLPIIRFSYAGLYPDGRPRPYRPIATHQSLVTSARLLAVQVEQVNRSTGQQVTLLAQSEGALITRYYLTTIPHPAVNMVALASPPIRAGRVYYPPRQAHTGWGIATGWELRAIFATLSFAHGLPNSADEPFIRSLLDNAPIFRNSRILCPVNGVSMIAFLPVADALSVPPGIRAQIPVVEVPGLHGRLLGNAQVHRSLVDFLADGQAESHTHWYYLAVERGGTAWTAPALRVTLNPVWRNIAHGQTARAAKERETSCQ